MALRTRASLCSHASEPPRRDNACSSAPSTVHPVRLLRSDFVPFAGHFFCETMHAAHAKQRLHRDHDATREAQRGGPRDRPREALSGTGTAPAAQLTPAELVALAAEPKKKHGHHGHHETDSADNTADGGKDERPYLVFVGDSIVAGQLQVCVG